MTDGVEYRLNAANSIEVEAFLRRCDEQFFPTLSSRVDIAAYAGKIVRAAERFEAWSGSSLVGLVAAYCNDPDRQDAFITSVSVLPAWSGRGVGMQLLQRCILHAGNAGFRRLSLDVEADNAGAIRLYARCGFKAGQRHGSAQHMHLAMATTGESA
jgi:ribosomal protein S18 acetylase RimI-like enzyme